jgi:UDP:flavonoid glycosyltransferase YjiC (YdhE family)
MKARPAPLMRVFISTRLGAGHLSPMITFAHALLRNNDEVIVSAPASGAAAIAEAGLDHHPIPDPPEEQRTPVIDRARTLAPDDANALVASELFVRIDTRAGYPHQRAAIERWRPDVVLYDMADFAAGLAAEATGVPAVSVGVSPAIHLQRLALPIAEALDEVRAEVGLDPDPRLERLTTAPCFTLIPPALETPGTDPPTELLRFRTEPAAPRPLPDWWGNDEWPLIYLTLGTVVPIPGLHRAAVDALSTLPVRVLMTVGRDRDPSELGPVAPNVHVARWVPQADVMHHAAAIVCHGGSGTVTAALAAGVPAVVVPMIADQYENAGRIAELGAGVTLDHADIVRLPDAVRAVLADRSYRDVAGRLADEISALPTVDTAAAILRAYSQPRSVA